MEGIVLKLRTPDGREVRPAVQRPLTRLGHLAPPVGDTVASRHVRCSCDDCGAHLLGSRTDDGAATGICLVCGSIAISPV